MHDASAAAMERWLALLERDAATARANGELPAGSRPADIAFELNALASATNNAFQLHRDPAVFGRARRLMRKVLAKPLA
jgi:hypothetical protein